MDTTTAFSLGLSGLGTSVIVIIGWIIAKGIRSRCVAGGNVYSIDIHKATPADDNSAPQTTRDSVVVHVHTPAVTTVDEHVQPALHPIVIPPTHSKIPKRSIEHIKKVPTIV